jgi:hypothetical protein
MGAMGRSMGGLGAKQGISKWTLIAAFGAFRLVLYFIESA